MNTNASANVGSDYKHEGELLADLQLSCLIRWHHAETLLGRWRCLKGTRGGGKQERSLTVTAYRHGDMPEE